MLNEMVMFKLVLLASLTLCGFDSQAIGKLTGCGKTYGAEIRGVLSVRRLCFVWSRYDFLGRHYKTTLHATA